MRVDGTPHGAYLVDNAAAPVSEASVLVHGHGLVNHLALDIIPGSNRRKQQGLNPPHEERVVLGSYASAIMMCCHVAAVWISAIDM